MGIEELLDQWMDQLETDLGYHFISDDRTRVMEALNKAFIAGLETDNARPKADTSVSG